MSIHLRESSPLHFLNTPTGWLIMGRWAMDDGPASGLSSQGAGRDRETIPNIQRKVFEG